jgi:hypothetical protein
VTPTSTLAVREELALVDLAVLDQAESDERPTSSLDRSLVAVLPGRAKVLVARVRPPFGGPRRKRSQELEKGSGRSR